MKRIKLFEDFNEHDKIHSICSKYAIRNYVINSDGTVDVDGDVRLTRKLFTKLPLKFGKVTGDFDCDSGQLTSLEGSPNSVGGYFNCAVNKLVSLEGGPKIVKGDYYCADNNITTLEGGPDYIGGRLFSDNNPVESLWYLFRDCKHIELFNDLDIVRDNKTIILQRLNEFLDMIGKPKVTEVKGYTCI